MESTVDNQLNSPTNITTMVKLFASPMEWDLWIRQIRCRQPLPKGLVEGALAGISIIQKNSSVINLILWLLVFLD